MTPDAQPRTGWQPSALDRLLLQALLLPDPAGPAAYQAWSARLPLDDVAGPTFHLLPQLYQALARSGAASADLARLKGISRKVWYENQLRLSTLGAMLDVLEAAGIEALLLRGAIPLQAEAARNNNDLACGVAVARVPAALEALARAGWRCALPGAEALRHWRYRASLPFRPAAGGDAIELVWRFSPAGAEAWAGLWQRRRPVCVVDRTAHVPSHTDQLWLAAAIGVAWRPDPDWRWLVDCAGLIQAGGLRWSELLETCRAQHTVRQMQAALTYLSRELAAPVPAAVFEQFQAAPVPAADERTFRLTRQRLGRIGASRRRWLQYTDVAGGHANPVDFVRYLEAAWGLPSRGATLRAAGRRMLRGASRPR